MSRRVTHSERKNCKNRVITFEMGDRSLRTDQVICTLGSDKYLMFQAKDYSCRTGPYDADMIVKSVKIVNGDVKVTIGPESSCEVL